MKKGIIVAMDLCVGCHACAIACKQENQVGPGVQWNQIQRHEDPKKGIITYFRMSCMHCDEPACLPVCPAKAIHKGEAGEVLVDSSKCIGCHLCETVCPWHVPMFNKTGGTQYWDKPPLADLAVSAFQKRVAGKAEHCTLCSHRQIPACVDACKLGALNLVDYDNPTEQQAALIAKAVPMNGAKGTKPKVRYISDNVDVLRFKRRMV